MSLALKKAYVKIPEHLVGLSCHVEKILKILSLETQDVRIIGIHGMGGIGKTTLAKFVYNHLLPKFQGASFLDDARSKDIDDLKRNLRSDILARKSLNYVDKGTIDERFIEKRVLIVIDDVDEKMRIEDLIGKRDKRWFALGSRIILTTRNEGFLRQVQVDESYELSGMEQVHSLQLFCRHAFGSDKPKVDYAILSEQLVETSGGLPLALEVIGSMLRNKSKQEWKNMLEKLKDVPAKDVSQKLRISYDELDKRQQHIFLDIACFFIGLDIRTVIYFWDPWKFYPKEAINVLQQKSLIKIRDNLIWIHDQLRDLGREIVREGNIMEPEKQTRLWNQEEATKVLMTKRGTEKIQGICVEVNEKSFPHFVEGAFAKLPEVRLFWVKSDFGNCLDQPLSATSSKFLHVCSKAFAELSKVRLSWVKSHFSNYFDQPSNATPSNFPHIFLELKWLSWHQFPSKYIKTSNFSLVNLTILDLSYSRFTIHWDGWTQIKMAEKLKVLNLTGCKNLEKTPELSSHPLLEQLILEGCSALVEIHESMGMLEHLVHLNLKGCVKLRKLPKDLSRLESLTELLFGETSPFGMPKLCGLELEAFIIVCKSLENCISLHKTFPRKLELNDHQITLIPDSIRKLVYLTELHLIYCYSLKKLPESIGGLVLLTKLVIRESGIDELPNSIGMAKNLKMVNVESCRLLHGALPRLPESLEFLNLPWGMVDAVLVSNLSYLINLKYFGIQVNGEVPGRWAPIESPGPWWLSSMERLGLAFPRITALHPDLSSLSLLTRLTLEGCVYLQSIPKLPSKLQELKFNQCESLEMTIFDLSYLTKLSCLRISKSPLIKLEGLRSLESLQRLRLRKHMVSKLDELPENLISLSISNCENLERLLQMSQYKELRHLYLSKCPNLVEIHGRLESLRTLWIEGCESLIIIPDVLNVETLKRVYITDCPKLFNDERWIEREGPILMDNSSKSESEQSFIRNMLRICGYSENIATGKEEEKRKGKRKREWVDEEEETKCI